MSIGRVFIRYSLIPLALLVVCLALSAPAQVEEAQRIPYYAEDSLQMSMWVTSPESDSTTSMVVLLPMMAHTHESYEPFLNVFASYLQPDSAGGCSLEHPRFCSFDLRGHGRSTVRGNDTLAYRTMREDEFAKYPRDVAEGLEAVAKQRGGQPGNLVVIGASVGANTAIMLTEIVPDVSKVVLLSPGEDYRGLKPAEALKKFKGKVLIFASENDSYAAASSRKLAAMNDKHCTLHIFEGANHGTDIIDNNPEAMEMLLDWLCAP